MIKLKSQMICLHYIFDRRKEYPDPPFSSSFHLLNYQKITHRHMSLAIIISVRSSLNHKVR